MSVEDGAEAHGAGEPISACPWSPSDSAGHEWRRDWIAAEGRARQRAGTFDHTPEEYAAYKRRMGMDVRPDPAVELGIAEPPPEPLHSGDVISWTVTWTIGDDEVWERMREAVGLRCERVLRDVINGSGGGQGGGLLGMSGLSIGVASEPVYVAPEPSSVIADHLERRARVLRPPPVDVDAFFGTIV